MASKHKQKFLAEFADFLVLIAEELPNILTIVVIPSVLGIVLYLPHMDITVSIILSILLTIYLGAKSRKRWSGGGLNWVWIALLLETGIASVLLITLITSVAKMGVVLGLRK